MISRKRVKDFNKILTCLLCKGYLIEATTINTCMHSFCRSCITKHVKLYEKCPTCESETRLGNLRPDIRLRSIVYKIIPGLYAKERQKINHDIHEQRLYINGTSGANSLVDKHERQNTDICSEDEKLAKQYFYDPEEPISLSLEYHMESIFGSNASLTNIPQVRYLQAPAAFKVLHLKKFLSSKYDLNNLKKPMSIDIIYEGNILFEELSLMDIAYSYNWEREAPLKLFYRIYKSKKHNNNTDINLIKKALINQPFVKLSSEFKKIMEPNNEVSDERRSIREPKETLKRNGIENGEAPRHDLKIIIAKKPSSKSSKFFDSGNNKVVRLNKPNSGSNSKVLNDFERLRGNVDNFTSASSSEIASTSEMKTTLSKKTGTVSHHDLKLENKSNTKRHNNDSHDFYEFTMNEGEKEKCDLEKQQQKRESTKHTNSSSSGRNNEKFKVKSNLSLNIPKLKIELPSLKTKITVPKTPNESYSIAKSPFSNSKCEPQIKKVRFDMSNTSHAKSNDRLYDFEDETESNYFDQRKYAERIGLKPVERKVESIILHRKRKKSKHSKEIEHSKRPKLHVSSSLDESLKLKLKIMGGKNCKNDKKFNEEEASERTCNLKAVHCKTADLSSINVHEVKHKKHEQEKQKEAVVELENHKYSVTEQKITKTDSNQPMVFIPKLVLQKTTTSTSATTFTANKTENNNNNNNSNNTNNKKEETTQVQRRNSILLDQHKQQQSLSSDANKLHEIKIKIKPLDKASQDEQYNQKVMKPPHAKMGSPSSTLSSPIRPNSIPASLKLSPISSPTFSTAKNDAQNLKRSLSLGAEKSPHCYFNPYAKSNTEMFTREPPLVKIPPLVATSPTIRNIFSNSSCNEQQNSKAPVSISKVPNINVKDPMKLFPNACPSVEILKIPQTAPIVNQQPLVKNVKLNRQMPPTIPLEKIKQSAQNSPVQKYLPKSHSNHLQHNNLIKTPSYHQQKINIPHSSSISSGSANSNLNSFNAGISHNTNFSQDLTLERYHYELSKDIAKLDQSLSLEKNFEHWGKQKLQEFSKVTDVKSFSKNFNNQQMSMSVRNIPNPSALMMFRNQNSSLNQKPNAPSSPTAVSSSPKQTVTSTSTEHSDIEEFLSKSTIAKGTEKPFFENNSHNVKPAANHSAKINEKKSIAKLTEFLRLTATAAQSKETRQDEDNNNNNNITSLKNDKNFNLIDGSRANASIVGQKSSPLDVIYIDS